MERIRKKIFRQTSANAPNSGDRAISIRNVAGNVRVIVDLQGWYDNGPNEVTATRFSAGSGAGSVVAIAGVLH